MTNCSSLDYWTDKVALVLPSHTHCGVEVVLALLSQRMQVVGVAPRLETMETLRAQLPNAYRDKFQTHDCDFHAPLAIKAEVLRMKRKYGAVDLLIHLQSQKNAAAEESALQLNELSGAERQAQQGAQAFLEAASRMTLLSDTGRTWTLCYRQGQRQQGAELAARCLQEMSARP